MATTGRKALSGQSGHAHLFENMTFTSGSSGGHLASSASRASAATSSHPRSGPELVNDGKHDRGAWEQTAWIRYKDATYRMLRIVGQAAPASDLHMVLATRLYLLLSQGKPPQSKSSVGMAQAPVVTPTQQREISQARARVERILKDRYGPVSSDEAMEALVNGALHAAMTVGI